MNTAHLDAMFDMALEDERAFEDIDDLSEAKALLKRVSRVLSATQLLERIGYSPYTTELLGALPKMLGLTYLSLHPIMQQLSKFESPREAGEGWSRARFTDFSNCYWQAVIDDRIDRNGPRRAWDEVKKAVCSEPAHLALTADYAEMFVTKIFALVEKKEGKTPELPEPGLSFNGPVPALRVLWKLYNFPEPDNFGYPLWYHEEVILTQPQRKMIALARHFAQKRHAKKRN